MCSFFFLQRVLNSLRLNSTHICTVACAVCSGVPAVKCISNNNSSIRINTKKAFIIVSMCKISVSQLCHVDLSAFQKKEDGRRTRNYSFHLGATSVKKKGGTYLFVLK